MNKRNRLEAHVAVVAFGVLGWSCLAVSGESSFHTACAGYGVFCLMVAHFVLGYMNGRR